MKDCVSLDIAKELKEAWWKQDRNATFSYINLKSTPFEDYSLLHKDWIIDKGFDFREFIAAPTIGELLEALPYDSNLERSYGGGYHAKNDRLESPVFSSANNPADALALLWLALKEKNLL